MNFIKIFSLLLLVLAVTLTNAGIDVKAGGRASGFSSPSVEITPNGDVVSHYAPYHHPSH